MAIRAPGHELAIRGQTLLLETVTRNLRLLEQEGLIRIDRGEDRREREVRLPDRGRDILAPVYPIWTEVQAQVATRFGGDRFARLLSNLSALVEVTRLCESFLDI